MRDRVRRKVKRMWPDADPDEILAVLNGYGAGPHEIGRERVQLAILKLSRGDRARLPALVAAAKRDWRDVAAYAESPEAMRMGPIKMRELSPRAARALRRRDKRQYRRWLRR